MGCLAGLLPLLPLGFAVPWWRFAEFQAARGLQVESLYASALWLGKWLGLISVSWEHTQKWYEVHGRAATAILPWARVVFLLVMLISTAFSVRMAARSRETSPARLGRILLLPLLGFVAFNQVFSPQFMIWLLPLASLTVLQRNPLSGGAVLLAAVLTPVIFPSFDHHYRSGLNFLETLVLTARNLILVSLWISLLLEASKSKATNGPVPGPTAEPDHLSCSLAKSYAELANSYPHHGQT
jgi:hypothetical protein